MSNVEIYNNTFSGTDMIASIVFPNCAPITIGELATASYSIYREKNPVRTLSKISVRGFTKGSRTVAGTLIFTVFDKHIVNRIRAEVPYLRDMVRIKTDELPTFDLYITMGNEYGASARINLYGLTIVDEGKVLSIEDLFTENQWSYMARDIDLLDDIGAEQNKPLTEFREADEINGSFTSDTLVMDNTFEQMQKELQAYKDAQKAKVEAERAAELKKYTYTVPDLSYKPVIDVSEVADGGEGDTIWHLTDSEKAHLYDKNRPQITVTDRHVADKNFDDAYKENNGVRSVKVAVRADNRLDGGKPFLSGVTIGVDIAFNDDEGHYVRDYVGKGTINNDLTVILDLHEYHNWTPTKPTIILYVAKGHRSLKDAKNVPYVVVGDNTKTINSDSEGRPDNVISFVWAEEGSTSAGTATDVNSMELTLSAKGFGQVISDHAVKIYRDAHITGKKNDDGSYRTTEWLTKRFLVQHQYLINPFHAKNYNDCKPEKVDSGFRLWISDIKKGGKYFSFDNARMYLVNTQISCDVVIGVDIGNGGETVISNGSQANANAFTGISDDDFHDSFHFSGAPPISNGGYKDFYIYTDTPLISGNKIFINLVGGAFDMICTHSKEAAAINLSDLKATFRNWKATYIPPLPGEAPISFKVNGPELKVIVDVMTTETLSEIK